LEAALNDIRSRRITVFALGCNLVCASPVEIVKSALMMALGRRKPGNGLIHHSDRGIQYACDEYRRLLQSHGMISSMSRSGNCLDNAVAERFFCTLK
jgi:transposase InsO family protein